MEEYQAKSTDSLCFELTRDAKPVGKLTYKSWFRFNALVETSSKKNYQIEPKGFWGTTIELKDGEKVLLNFSMSWKGEIVIRTFFDEIEQGYIFKHRGIFKDSFVLIDPEGAELLVMKPHLKWMSMSNEYMIITTDDFERLKDKDILIMAALHSANYYMSMMASYM